MRFSLFALPLFALSALTLTACSVPIDTVAGNGGLTFDEKGCPENGLPDVGALCDKDVVCPNDTGKPTCASDPGRVAVCADGAWNVDIPLACSAASALTCDPVGKWEGTRSGPYVYSDTSAGAVTEIDQIQLEIVKGADGVLRVRNAESGDISADGCQLYVFLGGSSSCSEHNGESFCVYWGRYLTVDLSKNPAEATITESCAGECEIDASAPFVLEKKP